MCTYVCVYICMCVRTYVHRMYIRTCTYVCMYVHVHMYVCMYVCMKFNPFDYLQKGTIVLTSSQPKTILEMAKRLSWSDDIKARESHARSLISQGSTIRLQDVNSYAIWSQTALSLSDRVLSFSLNSI